MHVHGLAKEETFLDRVRCLIFIFDSFEAIRSQTKLYGLVYAFLHSPKRTKGETNIYKGILKRLSSSYLPQDVDAIAEFCAMFHVAIRGLGRLLSTRDSGKPFLSRDYIAHQLRDQKLWNPPENFLEEWRIQIPVSQIIQWTVLKDNRPISETDFETVPFLGTIRLILPGNDTPSLGWDKVRRFISPGARALHFSDGIPETIVYVPGYHMHLEISWLKYGHVFDAARGELPGEHDIEYACLDALRRKKPLYQLGGRSDVCLSTLSLHLTFGTDMVFTPLYSEHSNTSEVVFFGVNERSIFQHFQKQVSGEQKEDLDHDPKDQVFHDLAQITAIFANAVFAPGLLRSLACEAHVRKEYQLSSCSGSEPMPSCLHERSRVSDWILEEAVEAIHTYWNMESVCINVPEQTKTKALKLVRVRP